VIGRDPTCEAALADPAVSFHHALVAFGDGSWMVEDLDSSNGITRNGEPVLRAHFRPGDHLGLGGTEMLVVGQEALLDAAAPQFAPRTSTRRTNLVMALAAALVGLLAVGGVLTWRIVSGPSTEHVVVPPFTDEDRIRLEKGLASGDPDLLREAVDPTVIEALGGPAEIRLPEGTSVEVEQGSFDPLGPSLAWITVRLEGGPGGRWHVLLILDDGQWKAFGTEPL
jgi:hypothetical protein